MNIPMPSPEERRRSFDIIKARGLPKKKTLFSVVLTLVRTFSFENLFFGTADCLCIAFMIFAALVGTAQVFENDCVIIVTVVTAPFFYLSAYLLSVWKEYLFNTLSVQRACKYTPMYMTAFRMLAFSLLAVALNVPASFLASLLTPSSFPKLILFSVCSLFCYAVLMTALQILTSQKWVHTVFPALWTAVIIGISAIDTEAAEKRLMNLSALVPGILTVILILVYIAELNIYVKKGEKTYVDC